jgi:hypothetical protein
MLIAAFFVYTHCYMHLKRSVNFIYAVFFITAIAGVCTFFIVRTTENVSADIDVRQQKQDALYAELFHDKVAVPPAHKK